MWFGSEYVKETFIVHALPITLSTPASYFSLFFLFFFTFLYVTIMCEWKSLQTLLCSRYMCRVAPWVGLDNFVAAAASRVHLCFF